jgi:hypothetical protein
MKRLLMSGVLVVALFTVSTALMSTPASAGFIRPVNATGGGQLEQEYEFEGSDGPIQYYGVEESVELWGPFSGEVEAWGYATYNEITGLWSYSSEEGDVEGTFANCVNGSVDEYFSDAGQDNRENQLSGTMRAVGDFSATFSYRGTGDFEEPYFYGEFTYQGQWYCAQH